MAEHDQSTPLLTPTKEIDLEAGGPVEQNQCRICLKTDETGFIATSISKTTSKYVHRECLDQLRSTKEGFVFVHCANCKTQCHMKVQTAGVDSKWRTLKSRFFFTRDILSIFLSVQIAIALLGYLVYLVDASQNFLLRLALHVDAVVSFYYMCGALLLSVLFGWFGCFLTCSESRLRGDLAQPCPQLTECCCSSRWPKDNDFYEAVITNYNASEGPYALACDVNTKDETWELVNPKEISTEAIRWEGGDIEILHTEMLVKEVERVFGADHPDPLEMEKAKKVLKDQEQALVDAIARLTAMHNGGSDD